LLDGAVDPENDAIALRRINGTVVTTWPHYVNFNVGRAEVSQNGPVIFDDLGNSAALPDNGERQPTGSFTFTLWDGDIESQVYSCNITLVAPAKWSSTVLRFDATATKLDFE